MYASTITFKKIGFQCKIIIIFVTHWKKVIFFFELLTFFYQCVEKFLKYGTISWPITIYYKLDAKFRLGNFTVLWHCVSFKKNYMRTKNLNSTSSLAVDIYYFMLIAYSLLPITFFSSLKGYGVVYVYVGSQHVLSIHIFWVLI